MGDRNPHGTDIDDTGARNSDRQTIDLPLQTRGDVRLQPESIDRQARTIEVLWSSGAPVRRRDPFTGRRYD